MQSVNSNAASEAHAAGRPRRDPPQPLAAISLPDALLRIEVVQAATGLSSSSLYRKVASKEFPAPVKLGSRCTRWKSGDVRAWLASQQAA